MHPGDREEPRARLIVPALVLASPQAVASSRIIVHVILENAAFPEWQHMTFDVTNQMVLDSCLACAASWKERILCQSRMMHQAMLIVLNSVNSRSRDNVPWPVHRTCHGEVAPKQHHKTSPTRG